MEIIAIPTPAITLEYVMEIAYAEEVLTDVLAVKMTDILPAIDVDMLADVNANDLAAVMTPIEFALSSP